MIWTLPSHVFEDGLPRFLTQAAVMDASDEAIILDFRHLVHWMPAPIVYTCALVHRWVKQGRSVAFRNHENCKGFRYLQRMDFFNRVGLQLPEHFRRHGPGTDFVEIEMIPPGVVRLMDPIAQRLSGCLAGGGEGSEDIKRFSEFAMGEIIANVQQHALEDGFCSAQYVGKKDWARIGVGDTGRGILASFRENNSPHYRLDMTHRQAMELALRAWVSSRNHLHLGEYGEPANRGVGLNMVHHMVTETFGILVVASGDVVATFDGKRTVRYDILDDVMPGTLVSIRFSRQQIPEYGKMLEEAQRAMNLTLSASDDSFFE